jgi:hypothetical protein
MEGHDEYPVDNFEFHTHFEGVAGHGHGESASAIVQMRAHGVGRMRRALESFGYEVRKIVPATLTAIPSDCAAVIDANPRTTYLPGESEMLLGYLAQGGSALLLYDLGFVLESRLAAALSDLGITVEEDVVIDPLDHYSTDPEVVAIPVYEPHAITRKLALAFFPGIRSLTLRPPPAGVTSAPLFRGSPATAPPRGPPPRPPAPASARWRSPSRGTGRERPARGRSGSSSSATATSRAIRSSRTWPTATWRSRWCGGSCARSRRPRSPSGCRSRP